MYYKLIFNIMNNILSLNSAAKLQLIFDIHKFLFVFFDFYVIFVDSKSFLDTYRHKKYTME